MLSNLEFHHIGLATSCIEGSSLQYEKLGYIPTKVIHDEIQDVYISFLNKEKSPMIELVMPATPTSPVNNILKNCGTSPYHFCYETISIEKKISDFRREKYILIQKPVSAIAFNNRTICFLYHKQTGVIELLETKK